MMKYSLLITFFVSLTTFAQNYTGSINSINESGLHKIMLPIKVRAVSNENYNFLRIKDSLKNDVPYVLIYNNDKKFSTFQELKIASKNVIKDSVTSIVIENKSAEKTASITLKIANTKIRKSYNVYGSDNGSEWFGLISNRILSPKNSPKKTASGRIFLEQTINFPLNTYPFLRINFNDKNSLPINILEAGIYKSEIFTQNAIEINQHKQESISTEKKKKVTQLKFTAENSHNINSISFKIDSDFFLRNAKILVKRERKIKKRVETYTETIASFQLNSKNKNSFTFNNLNEKEFIIEIQNKDNPALAIENIQLFQKPIYLIANLKKANNYKIIVDSTLTKPSYDLGNFISSTTKNISETSITSFSKNKSKTVFPKNIPFWQTTIFMWICIVLSGGFIIYFAFSLIKDISNQEKKQS
ncbi:hypothetical protein PG913_12190 [Tenacibaculum pacificus]|uniref:hypothetical protein n=1 Tax=Tenacibaculum pacificus TaxID=3018314 RepID=UPI0022F3AC17|nr:hypothetical protein [Tenacibaculum pacificus]WBX73573.1 hypothetical protein PG913_12190 [Tenacibaculum pacificus]